MLTVEQLYEQSQNLMKRAVYRRGFITVIKGAINDLEFKRSRCVRDIYKKEEYDEKLLGKIEELAIARAELKKSLSLLKDFLNENIER